MLNKFYPYKITGSIYEIDFEALYKDGVRGLLFDIDNTLVADEAPVNDAAVKLFERINKIGFRCYILSNNDEPRVKPFADAVGAPYFFLVHKPSSAFYIKAMKEMGTNISNTIMLGDQLITDICGANNAGIKGYYVKAVDKQTERFHIKLKRILEKIILHFYAKSHK